MLLLIRDVKDVDVVALRGSMETLARVTQAHTRLDPTHIQISKSHAHVDLRTSTGGIARGSWDVRRMRVMPA